MTKVEELLAFGDTNASCALRHKYFGESSWGGLQTLYKMAAFAGNRRAVIVPSLVHASCRDVPWGSNPCS